MTAITKTTVGLNLARDSYSGAQSPVITYVALGTSATPPTAADTQLGAEAFRKPVTSYTNGTTGEIIISMYFAPGDGVGLNLQEIGFIGGSGASAALNTGVLIAHGLYAHNPKTALESIQFSLDSVTA